MPQVSFTCLYCKNPFTRNVYPSSFSIKRFEFCSPACRNKARSLKNIPCPICGTLFKPKIVDTGACRKKYCSPACMWYARKGIPSAKRTPQEIRQMIKNEYPQNGGEELSNKLGIPISSIQTIAYQEGVKLDQDIYYEKVHKSAQEYMTKNNPMFRNEVKEKVKTWRKNNPDTVKEIERKLNIGHQKLQKDKPTKLELKLFSILDELGITYEPFAMIKPKFIVDAKIDNTIIQVDGEYWHGHPRFEPLTERQIAQQKRDKSQDAYLHKCGYKVIRIWEKQLNKDLVISLLEIPI